MRIAVVADVGGPEVHVGDAAMLEANLGQLRHHETFVIGRPDGSTLPSDVEALFVSGGGNLCSSWPGLFWQRIELMRQAHQRGLPVVLGGQTFGPALSRSERIALADVLAPAALIGAREEASALLLLQMGTDRGRVVYQPDDAIFLEPVGQRFEGEYLAVTLDPTFAAPESRAALVAIAGQLGAFAGARGLQVAFVPHASGDEEAGRALAVLLDAEGLACDVSEIMSPARTVAVTRGAQFVVSSRYHPLVFARGPAVGIYRDEYTRVKLHGALAHVGGGEASLPVQDAASGELWRTLDALWERNSEVRRDIAAALNDLRDRESARWERITRVLDGAEPLPPDDWSAPSLGPDIRLRQVVTSEALWATYDREGVVSLGRVLDDDAVDALRRRADDLALGRVVNEALQFQLDTGGAYDHLPAAQDSVAGSLLYRKIQGLEHDNLFGSLVRHPDIQTVCARVYGPHASVSIFRAMVMNKPAGQGTTLPWHQDGGDVWELDRDPLVTIWVALDDATTANGCMDVIPGSHRLGLLSPHGSTLSDADAARVCRPEDVRPLEVRAGHAVLMHNWLIHRSGLNPTSAPRRAFTACYMDARTRNRLTGDHFPLVFGTPPAGDDTYVRHLRGERDHYRASAEASEQYAQSLEEHRLNLERALAAAMKPTPTRWQFVKDRWRRFV